MTDREFSTGRALARGLGLAAATALLLPPYLSCRWLWPRGQRPIARFWHALALRAVGLRVVVMGKPPSGERRFFVANHVSYLDIPVLARHLDIAFVAKAEVASWPVFGFLARLTQTEFIERRPRLADSQAKRLAKRLGNGTSLLVFPEGTSGDGTEVLPFKSSLFAALEGQDGVAVQPITIAYESPDYAWFGSMTLGPHMWRVMGRKGTTVRLVLHPPLAMADHPTRKDLARASWQQVAGSISVFQRRRLTAEPPSQDIAERPHALANSSPDGMPELEIVR